MSKFQYCLVFMCVIAIGGCSSFLGCFEVCGEYDSVSGCVKYCYNRDISENTEVLVLDRDRDDKTDTLFCLTKDEIKLIPGVVNKTFEKSENENENKTESDEVRKIKNLLSFLGLYE